MNKSKTRLLLPVVGGILLIAAGVIFLLDNLGIIRLNWEVLIGPLFAVGGLAFLLVFILNPKEWWALIPGFVLVGLGVIIFMGQNMTTAADRWGGFIFLGFLGLAFLLIYATHRSQWWAVIPGGVLMTLAGVTVLPEESVWIGVVFFLGMALTFGLVYILPKPEGRMRWALYPAGILLAIGVLVLLGATNVMDFVLPLVLLIGGGFFIYRALRK
jgi:hypothetical protein